MVDADVEPPDQLEIERILGSFRKGIPDQRGGKLSEIVIAGWLRLREDSRMSAKRVGESALTILNEIVLKTIEVSEFNRRVRSC
jgi:hypothetical protein